MLKKPKRCFKGKKLNSKKKNKNKKYFIARVKI